MALLGSQVRVSYTSVRLTLHLGGLTAPVPQGLSPEEIKGSQRRGPHFQTSGALTYVMEKNFSTRHIRDTGAQIDLFRKANACSRENEGFLKREIMLWGFLALF